MLQSSQSGCFSIDISAEPLLQQRLMGKATAPAPAGSRIPPSSQESRLRNNPVKSRGDPTSESEKQHPGSRGPGDHWYGPMGVALLSSALLCGELLPDRLE